MPRYINIINDESYNMFKFNIFYNYIGDENKNKTKENLNMLLNKFTPELSKKYKIINKHQKGGNIFIQKNISDLSYINKFVMNNKNTLDQKFLINKIINFTEKLPIYIEEKNIQEVNNVFFEIELLSKELSWQELINFDFDLDSNIDLPFNNILNDYKNIDKYILAYQNYFNKCISIDNNNIDMLKSIIISLTTFNINPILLYDQINILIEHKLNENIYKILTLIRIDKCIYNDKINKNILVKIDLKNNLGAIIETHYEEHPEIYDFYYNNYTHLQKNGTLY
jgi:hypothetical protein